jgi:tetratricopeptide (TPR) repeat protein
MKSILISAVACFVSVPLFVRAEDKVWYRDRKSGAKEEIKGQIVSESIQGIKFQPNGKVPERLIPPADIDEIEYNPPNNITGPQMRLPFVFEEQLSKSTKPDAKKIDECLNSYRELISKLEVNENAQAYVQYRMALLLVKLSQGDPAKAEEARATLVSFKDKYPKSWEYPRVMQVLARVCESLKKLDDAKRAYEELAAREDLPNEVRGQANFALVRMLLHSGQVEPAETRLQELAKLIAKDGPDATRMQVYQVEIAIKKNQTGDAEKQLKAVLAGGVEDIKGHAANVLGDLYEAQNKREDALWQFLWVDVLYNQDSEEQARALFHLSKLFKEVRKDDAMAQRMRDKLQDPRFAGTEYQRMVTQEKSK